MSLIVWVWKLNGLRAPLTGGGPMLSNVPSAPKEGLKFVEGGIGELMEPNRVGKVSAMGERAFGSKEVFECTVRETPSIPSPPSSCSPGIGVGGVGVRGGAGIGRLEAIEAVVSISGYHQRVCERVWKVLWLDAYA
jgi:hypothetical protein